MTAVYDWNLDEPGKRCVLTGNESAARGAIEAGVRVATSYPGSPSVQILECLASAAAGRRIYAEWSINEKVALEVAAAGSFAGLRSICVMKADGLNVAMDFLTALPLSGIRAGLVIVVSDDPGAHSSVKEEDTRCLAAPAHVPLMEPSSPGETREMVNWAFRVSEETGLPIIVRLVTRICHARATVRLGEIRENQAVPDFPSDARFITAARFHGEVHRRLDLVRDRFESSPFNSYQGPEGPEIVVFAGGVSFFYALEAIELLQAEERAGIFKIGTLWPPPEKTLFKNLNRAKRVLFLEEIEPFIEDQAMMVAARKNDRIGPVRFFGKRSGHVPWVMKSRGMGEMDPDIATKALAEALEIPFEPGSAHVRNQVKELPQAELPSRLPSFCAGCPHRASYWAIKTALSLDGRGGFVLGDIGCYTLGVLPTGYRTLSTVHCMGSGLGMASGLGKLGRFGFHRPIVAVIGDSTFYHAGIPPLVNARAAGAQFLCIILDNGTTAMTGHQPHPGTGTTATGEPSAPVPVDELIAALGIPVTVQNPFEVRETTEAVLELLERGGLQVLVLRGECALKQGKRTQRARFRVEPELCLGDACGCARACSRVFSCPANLFDEELGKARIDELLCNGCGACSFVCPQGAIMKVPEPR